MSFLRRQAVAHARGRRGIDTEGLGEVDWALRAPGGEDDEGPVLRQGNLGLVLGQGAGGDGDQNPAGGEDSIGQPLSSRPFDRLELPALVMVCIQLLYYYMSLRDAVAPRDSLRDAWPDGS